MSIRSTVTHVFTVPVINAEKNKKNAIVLIPQWLLLLGCFIAVLLPVGESYATSNHKTDFDQLIKRADVIIVGRSTSVNTEWRKKKIYTVATIQVDDVAKGKAPSSIQIEYMGGTAVHPKLNVPIAMSVSNGVGIKQGDEAVFMLKQLAASRYQIVGRSRGKIPVFTDQSTGEKKINSGIRKIHATAAQPGDASVVSARKMNLAEFMQFIRSRVKLQAQGVQQ